VRGSNEVHVIERFCRSDDGGEVALDTLVRGFSGYQVQVKGGKQ